MAIIERDSQNTKPEEYKIKHLAPNRIPPGIETPLKQIEPLNIILPAVIAIVCDILIYKYITEILEQICVICTREITDVVEAQNCTTTLILYLSGLQNESDMQKTLTAAKLFWKSQTEVNTPIVFVVLLLSISGLPFKYTSIQNKEFIDTFLREVFGFKNFNIKG